MNYVSELYHPCPQCCYAFCVFQHLHQEFCYLLPQCCSAVQPYCFGARIVLCQLQILFFSFRILLFSFQFYHPFYEFYHLVSNSIIRSSNSIIRISNSIIRFTNSIIRFARPGWPGASNKLSNMADSFEGYGMVCEYMGKCDFTATIIKFSKF